MEDINKFLFYIEDSLRQIEKLNDYNIDNLERQYGWDELRDKDPILVCRDIQEYIDEIRDSVDEIRDNLDE